MNGLTHSYSVASALCAQYLKNGVVHLLMAWMLPYMGFDCALIFTSIATDCAAKSSSGLIMHKGRWFSILTCILCGDWLYFIGLSHFDSHLWRSSLCWDAYSRTIHFLHTLHLQVKTQCLMAVTIHHQNLSITPKVRYHQPLYYSNNKARTHPLNIQLISSSHSFTPQTVHSSIEQVKTRRRIKI